MEGSDLLTAGVMFLFAAGYWRGTGIFAGRDCDWPLGAGIYQRR